eukprot:42970-Eustigmatos_ZCMA.PRE.1
MAVMTLPEVFPPKIRFDIGKGRSLDCMVLQRKESDADPHALLYGNVWLQLGEIMGNGEEE